MSSPPPSLAAAASQDQENQHLQQQQQNSETQSSSPSTSTNSSNLPSPLQSTSIQQTSGSSSSPVQLLPTASQSPGNISNSDAQVQTANLAPEESNAVTAAENPEATGERPSRNSITHLRQLLRQLDNDLDPLSNPNALWNSVDSLLEVMGSFRNASRSGTRAEGETWFRYPVHNMRANQLLTGVNLSRHQIKQKARYNTIQFLNRYISKWFCYLWEIIFILLAIINISMLVYMRTSHNSDLFGIFKLPKFELPKDIKLYSAIIEADNRNVNINKNCSNNLQWFGNSCFNLKYFIDGESLPLIYTSNGWMINQHTKYLTAKDVFITESKNFILITINPYCCELRGKFKKFMLTNFAGIYPLLRTQIMNHIDLKDSDRYTNNNPERSSLKYFEIIFLKISQMIAFTLTFSCLISYIESTAVDYYIFISRVNVRHSSKVIINSIIWLSIHLTMAFIIIAFWISKIGSKLVFNYVLGYLFHSITVNKISRLIWPIFFHTFNLLITFIMIFDTSYNLDHFLITSHSIYCAVAMMLLYHMDIRNIDQMNSHGYILQENEEEQQ